jgi:hypothetical protein
MEVALAGGLLLRWMMWEPKRAMNNQPVNTLEAGISRLQPWRVSKNTKHMCGFLLALLIMWLKDAAT